MGISFEEKAFYDILVKVRDDHGFPYADEKCVVLAKKIKELVMIKLNLLIGLPEMILKINSIWNWTVLLFRTDIPLSGTKRFLKK